jgi:hypothetical protein
MLTMQSEPTTSACPRRMVAAKRGAVKIDV